MKDLLNTETNSHFSKELPADKYEQLSSRQVHEACYSFTETTIPANPELAHLSTELMKDLDI